ncbi:MAG: MCP four helix bundle domain-containing protein [Brevinematales bacterium]
MSKIISNLPSLLADYTWSFIIIISITIVSSIFSINYLNSLESEINQIFQYDVAGRSNIKDAYSIIQQIDSELKDLIIGEKEGRKWTVSNIRTNMSTVSNLIEKSGWRFARKDEKKLYNKSRQDLDDYIGDIDLKISGVEENNSELDSEFMTQLRVEEARLLADFSSLVLIKRNSISSVFKNIKLQIGTSLVLTSLLLVLTLIIRILMYINVRKINGVK